jgi:hypothetical protein
MTPYAREIRHLRQLVHKLRDEEMERQLARAVLDWGDWWTKERDFTFRERWERQTREMMRVPE